MNETIDTILKRHSVRAYQDRPIDPEHQDQILTAAFRAPTAGNLMLYSIIRVSDQMMKEKLVASCDHQPFIAQAPLVLVFLADYQRWWDAFMASEVPKFCQDNNQELRTPAEGDLLLACCDALIAAQNAVIAAEALGIGSCYIGDIMENYEFHQQLFDLPPYVFLITMLCLGYPKNPKPPKKLQPRYPKEYILHENTYQRFNPEVHREMLTERSPRQFHGNATNFGQHIYSMKFSADFTREMTRSVRAAIDRWTKSQ